MVSALDEFLPGAEGGDVPLLPFGGSHAALDVRGCDGGLQEAAAPSLARRSAIDAEVDAEDRQFYEEAANEAMGADAALHEVVDVWSPGMNVAMPNRHDAHAGGAGGSNDPLPRAQVQPEALAVVPQVAEPHAYVGAALRFVANSPPSRALTRLRASLLQQP